MSAIGQSFIRENLNGVWRGPELNQSVSAFTMDTRSLREGEVLSLLKHLQGMGMII